MPASLRSKLFGATARLTGVVAALVIGGALFLGDGILELVPAPLVGGILVFAGLGMLDEGLVKNRKRLPWSEYGIILLIFLAITSFGLIEGVGVGMLATLVFFAVRLSRVDPIESQFTAREHESNKARPVPDRAILLKEGERVQIYRLRGYIFFGSVSPSGRSSQAVSERRFASPLPVARLCRCFRLRLLGSERPEQVSADGEYSRGADRSERIIRGVEGRA